MDPAGAADRERVDALRGDDERERLVAGRDAGVAFPADLQRAVDDDGLDQRNDVVVAGDRKSLAVALADLDARVHAQDDAVEAGHASGLGSRHAGPRDLLAAP